MHQLKDFREHKEELDDLKAEKEHLVQEVAHLKKTLDDWEGRHQLHLKAYQDNYERQEEQLNQMQAKVCANLDDVNLRMVC